MRPPAFKTGVSVAGVLCLCLILATATAWSSRAPHNVLMQAQEKVLETIPPIFNEPVRIVGVKVGRRDVEFGEKLTGASDWLNGAEFKLRNISGKEIVFIEVDVNLPETQATGPEMSFRINLGQIPRLTLVNRESLSLPPAGETNTVIDEKRHGELIKLVKQRHSVFNINKARVQIGFVVFADGTAWSAGSFYRQDPNNPKIWRPIAN